MIEFTLSRVVLCACGIVLISSVTGVLGGIYDNDVSHIDDRLADRIAYMLDVFDSSDTDELILDGVSILPREYYLRVHDNFVELYGGEKMHISSTNYGGNFELSWNGIVTVTHRRFPLSSLRCL